MVIQFSRNSFEQHASKQFTYDSLKLLCPNSYKLIKIWLNISNLEISLYRISNFVYFSFFGLTHPW